MAVLLHSSSVFPLYPFVFHLVHAQIRSFLSNSHPHVLLFTKVHHHLVCVCVWSIFCPKLPDSISCLKGKNHFDAVGDAADMCDCCFLLGLFYSEICCF